MIVSGMVKSSLVDYPGHVACVLFVPGCNYNCFYCHNRSLLAGEQTIISHEFIDGFLLKRAGLLDAVVISGGEPTLQPDLLSYAQRLKRIGFKLKLDTNGSAPQVIKQLVQNGVFDYYAVDYKAPAQRYREICGSAAEAAAVLDTINLLMGAKVPFEVRTTVIPQLSETDLIQMASELPALPRYVLNRYRKPETYLPGDQTRVEQTPYTQDQLDAFFELIRPWQLNVTA